MKHVLSFLAVFCLAYAVKGQLWLPDTGNSSPDSLSVPYKALFGPRFCFFDEHVIDSDSLMLAMKERCRDFSGDSIDFSKEILMFRHVGGDCHAWYKHRIFLDPSRKKLVWIVYNYYGGCRAGGGQTFWFIVPRPPEGYEVEMTTYLMDRNGDFEGVAE